MTVAGLDHVHLEVANRDEAADWYGRVLGLRRSARLAVWAEDPRGPLILETEDGATCLSLFARDARPPSRDATVALRTDGAGFLAFLDRLDGLGLTDRGGRPLGRGDAVDHDLSWSVYFADPWGNRLELTSYDHDQIAAGLG